jgi:transcriptional regulator with PAS, ATPase and Fis domain
MKLEHALSPMTRNRSIITQNAEAEAIELIKQIKQLKLDVINQRIDKKEISLIRPEILDSWIRSFNYGLSVFDYNFAPALGEEALQQRCQEKASLLASSEPFIQQLSTMLADSQCIILLSDEVGSMLRVLEGNKKLKDQNKRFKLVAGSIWNEETVGTCAHAISLIHGIPMQISGPEHYCERYDDIFCSSAPIFDGNQNLSGTLSIVSPSFHQQNAHSLGLVVSMAWAIQKDIQMGFNKELLSFTLDSADKGVLTLNKSGIITQANNMANNFFRPLLEHELIGMPYQSVLGPLSFIESVLEKGPAVFDTEVFLERWNQRITILSVQAISDNAGQNLGLVLVFKKNGVLRKGSSNKGHNLAAKFTFQDILGEAPELLNNIAISRRFSYLDANILIQGESGTGKEMFAHAIHQQSRPDGPFVAVNCAAIPSTLIESELFGYEGGSFTGAEKQGRPGKIELAHGGTLFLDEIGDMPLELQPVLLRVLDEKRVMRLGSSQYLPVDFRLISATNRDLSELVESKRFRQDLLYRLQVLQVNIPPLRKRGQDIVLLARYFAQKVAQQQGIAVPQLSDAFLLALLNYEWPGNVRQLENTILYAVNVCHGPMIGPEHLPANIREGLPQIVTAGLQPEKQQLPMKDIEKIFIQEALLQSDYNISDAALRLKMSRSTLYRKIKEYQIKTK